MRYFLVEEPVVSVKGKITRFKKRLYTEDEIIEEGWEDWQNANATNPSETFMSDFIDSQEEFIDDWCKTRGAIQVCGSLEDWLAERTGKYHRHEAMRTLVRTAINHHHEFFYDDIVAPLIEEAYRAGQNSVKTLLDNVDEEDFSILRKIKK